MLIIFISGGPCTGKTSVINELKRQGFTIIPEAAREIAAFDKQFSGKSIKNIDKENFQDEIFNFQKNIFDSLVDENGIFFSDRGLGDTIAYYKINNLEVPEYKFDFAKNFANKQVFILEPLNFYNKDSLRQESQEEQKNIQDEIVKTYAELKYNVIMVPFMSVSKRVEFIIGSLGS